MTLGMSWGEPWHCAARESSLRDSFVFSRSFPGLPSWAKFFAVPLELICTENACGALGCAEAHPYNVASAVQTARQFLAAFLVLYEDAGVHYYC
jgi:hypothetical protein